jgi:hypothetical protein
VEDRTTWDLLERIGAVRRGHFQQGDQHSDVALGAADPLADPSATNTLARRLAAELPDPSPDVIVVWAGSPSVLTGFVVGVALERRVVRLADDEGVVYASSPLQRGERAVLVGDFLSEREVRLAHAYIESRGAVLETLAALVDEGHVGAVVALASTEGHRVSAAACPQCQAGQPLSGSDGALGNLPS